MKTKLATLLIAPALLFTACGAKSLSIEEVTKFIKEHYTHTNEVIVEGKVKASWDFSKTTNVKAREQYLTILTEDYGIQSPKLTDNDVDCPITEAMLELVMNYQKWTSMAEQMPYGANFTVSNDELTIDMPQYLKVQSGPDAKKDIELIRSTTSVTFTNEGVKRYQTQKIDAYDFGEGYHYEGFMTFTAYDIKVTEPKL